VPESSELDATSRAKRYRDLAANARRIAAVAKGDQKAAYFMIASQWETLAQHLEAATKSGEGA
jgi:hypothetical protein